MSGLVSKYSLHYHKVGTSKSDGAVESSESDRAENIHLNTKRKKQSKSQCYFLN